MPRIDRKGKIHKTNAKAVESISFDPEARNEYLTGFHKRKVQRAEHGREVAQKKLKEAAVQARKEMREQRKVDLQNHLKEFNTELRKQNPDLPSESESEEEEGEGTFEGFGAVDEIDGQEDEYVDEDKYTTVTVEAMGGSDDEEEDKWVHVPKPEDDPTAFAKPKKRPTTKEGKEKKKRRNFRYETKAERKVTRDKQKKRNNKEAAARREANESKEKAAKSRKGKK